MELTYLQIGLFKSLIGLIFASIITVIALIVMYSIFGFINKKFNLKLEDKIL